MNQPIAFGKYYLLECIYVGGTAEIFTAKVFGAQGFDRLVAIKRALPSAAKDPELVTRFIDEARIAVQLNHPNICQVFDLGQADDSYFIALEFVYGRNLHEVFEHCKQRPVDGRITMPIAQACFIGMRICEGLEHAHNVRDGSGRELHFVHRGISPQNLLVSYDGEVKLIDLGIARAAGKTSKTPAGRLLGKLGYMSPEQVRGLPLDRRSDVFSVGVVLYELLTGERLFIGEDDFSTLEKVRNVEILPPSTYSRRIPDELERIVLKALVKDVEDRYQNAIDLHDDLQAFMYSAGEFYSRKDLTSWMKRTYANAIAAEASKLEAQRRFTPKSPPVESGEGRWAAAPSADVNRAGSPPAAPPTLFYISIDGKQQGPFSTTDLLAREAAGEIDLDCYVWREGWPIWKHLHEIDELVVRRVERRIRFIWFYAPEDEALAKELEKHISLLKRHGLVDLWHPGLIAAGDHREQAVLRELRKANLIVLLVSADFLASCDCYDTHMVQALERHASGTAHVIPVVLRHGDYSGAPFMRLQVLPRNGRPVASWEDRDAAWAEIVQAIRIAIEELLPGQPPIPSYATETQQDAGEALRSLYAQRSDSLAAGEETSEVDRLILEKRRELRAGPQLHPGEYLADGRYRLLDRIGHGGFATVWRAYNVRSHALVAIKVLHGQWAAERSRIERFFRGARQMARLKHPGIVRVIDEHGAEAGFQYFVMEFIRGRDLREAILGGAISLAAGFGVIRQTGQALQHAHGQGVIHRDVKPANILLDERMEAHLTDFDLAWAADTTGGTRTGALGTFMYAAPESMENGKLADARSDQYSLAMTALFVLHGAELPQIAFRDTAGFISKLKVQPRVIESLIRAVDWEPERRFASVSDFLNAFAP